MLKVTKTTLLKLKQKSQKISMLTAYDYPIARILDEAGIDVILVGDSLGNVILGFENTLPVTVDDICHHTKAVVRGTKRAMVVSDMPFGSFQGRPAAAVKHAVRLVKEGGAAAVKIEGAENLSAIRAILKAGVPVMGHLGFTPQSVNEKGGYRVQGKDEKEAQKIMQEALKLEKTGVFAIVLELMPEKLAGEIAEKLTIPVISCGAGKSCDGEVVVTYDMLGLSFGLKPKFVPQYVELKKSIHKAVKRYITSLK